MAVEYYDWNRTLSYDAPITFVITARGVGKTYGLRAQCIRDWLKDGSRFVALTRYKDDLRGSNSIQRGWFDKLELNGEFPEHAFKIDGRRAYIARKVAEGEKPQWHLIGYFTSLTDMHKDKQATYANVRRIIFDEAVIDRRTRHSYLPGEWGLLTNAFSSIAREEPGKPTKTRLYLLSNACDLSNPYLYAMGVHDEPRRGYSWHMGKLVLLHYMVSDDARVEAISQTVAGRMARGREDAATIARGEFTHAHSDLIARKPPAARYQAAFRFKGRTYAIWCDAGAGLYYVTSKAPRDARNVYAMTNEDNTAVNMVNAKRTLPIMRGLVDMHTYNALRFESEAVRAGFMRLLALFGVR